MYNKDMPGAYASILRDSHEHGIGSYVHALRLTSKRLQRLFLNWSPPSRKLSRKLRHLTEPRALSLLPLGFCSELVSTHDLDLSETAMPLLGISLLVSGATIEMLILFPGIPEVSVTTIQAASSGAEG